MALKDFLKDRFYILKVRDRFNAAVQISQQALYHQYQAMAHSGKAPPLTETGYRVFSQFEEDGKLLFIFACLGMGQRRFIDIGSDDGINSNCANLALNLGWTGLFIDGNAKSIRRGRRFYQRYPHPWMVPPKFVHSFVQRETINETIQKAGFEGEVDFLTIDIDGNDYWIWDALEVVQPRVVMIETHIEFGLRNIVVPYDPAYTFPGKHPVYHGASPVAMVKLAKRKGYRLVGANRLGFNFIFVKVGLQESLLPEVPVEAVLTHPSVAASYARFEPIKDWVYEEGK